MVFESVISSFSTAMLHAGDTEGMGGCCGGWGFMGLGWLFWFIILILIIVLVIALVSRTTAPPPPASSADELREEIRRLRQEIRELKEEEKEE